MQHNDSYDTTIKLITNSQVPLI